MCCFFLDFLHIYQQEINVYSRFSGETGDSGFSSSPYFYVLCLFSLSLSLSFCFCFFFTNNVFILLSCKQMGVTLSSLPLLA